MFDGRKSENGLGSDIEIANAALRNIQHDAEVARPFPKLASAISSLAENLYHISCEIEWDSTRVAKIEHDAQFEMLATGRLTVAASGATELAKGWCRVAVQVVAPHALPTEILQQVRET